MILVIASTTPPMISPILGITPATISKSKLNAATSAPPTSATTGASACTSRPAASPSSPNFPPTGVRLVSISPNPLRSRSSVGAKKSPIIRAISIARSCRLLSACVTSGGTNWTRSSRTRTSTPCNPPSSNAALRFPTYPVIEVTALPTISRIPPQLFCHAKYSTPTAAATKANGARRPPSTPTMAPMAVITWPATMATGPKAAASATAPRMMVCVRGSSWVNWSASWVARSIRGLMVSRTSPTAGAMPSHRRWARTCALIAA